MEAIVPSINDNWRFSSNTDINKQTQHQLKESIQNAIYFKNSWHRYQFIVLGHELTYFVKHETESKNCYTDSGIPHR
jgi:hypothetical protein